MIRRINGLAGTAQAVIVVALGLLIILAAGTARQPVPESTWLKFRPATELEAQEHSLRMQEDALRDAMSQLTSGLTP